MQFVSGAGGRPRTAGLRRLRTERRARGCAAPCRRRQDVCETGVQCATAISPLPVRNVNDRCTWRRNRWQVHAQGRADRAGRGCWRARWRRRRSHCALRINSPAAKGDVRDDMVQIIARRCRGAGVDLGVQVYPGASLFKPNEQWNAMVNGQLDIVVSARLRQRQGARIRRHDAGAWCAAYERAARLGNSSS